MGWFWATSPSGSSTPPAAHLTASQLPTSNDSEPSRCPVKHSPSSSTPPSTQQTSCPVRPSDSPFYIAPSSTRSNELSKTNISPPPAAAEPATAATESKSGSSVLSKLNPLNYMFADISQSRAPNQTVNLSVDREPSSIPRGDSTSKWEYPSPQQMYNAMLRKGYTDTPQDAVESMVSVHNFLNEGAWQEIVDWENIFARGLKQGWDKCKRGSENLEMELGRERMLAEHQPPQQQQQELEPPSLIRFMGRPQDRTPKATILQALGRVYPAKYGTSPPFDRHDWYVRRQTPSGPKEVRYVIDYYSGPPEPTGEPVFYLDIRPAVDTPTAAAERLMRWGGDMWWRASGGEARGPQADDKHPYWSRGS